MKKISEVFDEKLASFLFELAERNKKPFLHVIIVFLSALLMLFPIFVLSFYYYQQQISLHIAFTLLVLELTFSFIVGFISGHFHWENVKLNKNIAIEQIIEEFSIATENVLSDRDLAIATINLLKRYYPVSDVVVEKISPRGKVYLLASYKGNMVKNPKILDAVEHLHDNYYVSIKLVTSAKYVGHLSVLLRSLLLLFKQRNSQISKLYIDNLTGAYNKQYFEIVKNIFWTEENTAAVILFDIDNFKTINDTYGHHYGDQVLREVVNRVKSSIRSEDIIVRYGGDEFYILLSELPLYRVIEIVEIIGEKIRNIVIENDAYGKTQVSLSIGIIYKWQNIKWDMGTALNLADDALYVAKRNKDRYVVYLYE